MPLLKGRVLSIHSDNIVVEHDKELFVCVLRGLLKKEILHSNLVAPGDLVVFDPAEKRIMEIEERKSVLCRMRKDKEQIIGANIDQVLITVSVVAPPLKPALIDRYIIAARRGNMEPIIIINKIDLLKKNSKEYKLYKKVVEIYKNLGLTVIGLSNETKEGLEELKNVMKDKASLFSGQSGVGKSSLINSIANTQMAVGEIREKPRKGAHTTTRSELLTLPFGGYCIDTPGIRSFGVWELEAEDLILYFPEITEVAKSCRYPNCSHTHEPKCAVIAAVDEGLIEPIRFESFLKLQTELG